MKKFWLLAVLLVFILGSVSLAADSHTVTVSINSFARISVTGTASGVVSETDFDQNGNVIKDLNSTVQITVKTNKNNGCVISASAPDFANNFAISTLQVKFGVAGSYVPLANTATTLINLNSPQNNVSYPVSFRLVLNNNEPAGDYKTLVTYTVAPNI
jgi:hypothetical protein